MRLLMGLATVAILAGAEVGGSGPAMAAGYHVEYAFTGGADGQSPHSPLTSYGGQLYGTVPVSGAGGVGAIYAIDPATGAETVVYSFKGGGDGANPYSALIDVGGTLYGTTFAGGAADFGTVYSFDPASGVENVVYAFKGGEGDGALPGSLLKVGALVYGTTIQGGGQASVACEGNSCGTIFSLDPVTGIEKVVHAFTGGADGWGPIFSSIELGGKLYGTGEFGAFSGTCFDRVSCGMVFSFDPVTGAEAVVHAFAGGADGEGPDGLIKIVGHLWGTTSEGGASCAERSYGCGTVFELDPATGAKTIVHYFTGGVGGWGPAGLTKVGDALYGITAYGGVERGGGYGSLGWGTIYSLDLTTTNVTVLHAFHGGSDGRLPNERLIEHGRRLWGTTDIGGSSPLCGKYGCGTVFSIKP